MHETKMELNIPNISFFFLSTVLYSLDYSILDIQLKSQLLFINYITKYGKYKINIYIGMSREFFLSVYLMRLCYMYFKLDGDN